MCVRAWNTDSSLNVSSLCYNTQLVPKPTAVTWKTPLSISALWISSWRTKPTWSLIARQRCMQEPNKCRIINLADNTEWSILHFKRTQWLASSTREITGLSSVAQNKVKCAPLVRHQVFCLEAHADPTLVHPVLADWVTLQS